MFDESFKKQNKFVTPRDHEEPRESDMVVPFPKISPRSNHPYSGLRALRCKYPFLRFTTYKKAINR